MELSNKTAREIYQETKSNPTRAKFGFGAKAAIVNIDLQKLIPRSTSLKLHMRLTPIKSYISTRSIGPPEVKVCPLFLLMWHIWILQKMPEYGELGQILVTHCKTSNSIAEGQSLMTDSRFLLTVM